MAVLKCRTTILVREGNGGSRPPEYRTIEYNPKDYFLVKNVSINKVGTIVRERSQNWITKAWEDTYSAPILITVGGTCTVGPNKGKDLSIKGKEQVYLDEWSEWHYHSLWSPTEACYAIYENCKKPSE